LNPILSSSNVKSKTNETKNNYFAVDQHLHPVMQQRKQRRGLSPERDIHPGRVPADRRTDRKAAQYYLHG
jgi:hypothetical protein